MGHIRSACLRGLRATVAELGGDAEQLARTARLPVQALDGDDVLIGAVNEPLRRLALAFLAEQAPDVSVPLGRRVRAVVQESLGTRAIETAAVAALLAMHPRTLQRRLEAEGTTFGAVVDDARRDTAQRLLRTTDLPVGQIAHMVGFAEQSALSRAARRWWNRSPRQMRQSAERVRSGATASGPLSP